MSLLGLGESYKNAATSGFRDLAQIESNRNMQNDANLSAWELSKKQQEAAEKQNTMSTTATGAAAGWAVGAQAGSIGGPWGAAIGAVSGFLFSKLF